MVKNTMAHLWKKKNAADPGVFVQSAFKYAGYFLGKRYPCLPGFLVRKCTMNRAYWEKNKNSKPHILFSKSYHILNTIRW